MAFSYSYINRYADSLASSPVDFSVSFGDADAARSIIVVIQTIDGSPFEITGVTIGGVSATIVATSGSSQSPACIAIAAVPTGTSGTVSVTHDLGGDAYRISCAVFRTVDLASATPTDTAVDLTTASGVLDLDLNLPTDGFWVAGAAARNGNTTTWGRGTEHFDVDVDVNDYLTVASEHPVGPNTPLTLTVTNAETAPDDHIGVAASWQVINVDLTADAITGSAPVLDTPVLSIIYALTANDLTGETPVLDTPEAYIYKQFAGGDHIGDGGAPYLSVEGDPAVISPAGSANGADISGSAGSNSISGNVGRHVVGPLLSDD